MPPTSSGRRPRASMSAIAARAAAWNSDTVNSSAGSTRSSRWCGTARCSAGVGLAVPMSMPRYTCMESTVTISRSPSAAATARATEDLPDAVHPTRASRVAGVSLN